MVLNMCLIEDLEIKFQLKQWFSFRTNDNTTTTKKLYKCMVPPRDFRKN